MAHECLNMVPVFRSGDLVEVSFTLEGHQHQLLAIITSVDERSSAFHCRAKAEDAPYRHVVANADMLRMITPNFVAEDRRRLMHYPMSKQRKISRKMGNWWLNP